MLAVHFGAGNIGRGFIGQLLYESGYDICFVDINQTLVDDINNNGQYMVRFIDGDIKELCIRDISAVNINNKVAVIEKLLQADLVTTAVGANILERIAPVLAEGLSARLQQNSLSPLNIIACENMLDGSLSLKKYVYEYFSKSEQQSADIRFGFPNAAVDRIVPPQKIAGSLDVVVESFFEWDVDCQGVVGTRPVIKGINYVDNLQAYIERKLYAVNAIHAGLAYLGYIANIDNISDVFKNDEIMAVINEVSTETGRLLIKKYNFNEQQHLIYAENILKRFANPLVSDPVIRVARSPIRKISKEDRLTAPFLELTEQGMPASGLAKVIAAALCFDYKKDIEAVELQNFIRTHSPEQALEHYTGIKACSSAAKCILSEYAEFKNK